MLGFSVESRTGVKPFEAGTAKAAIQSLADHGAIRIVICEYPGISDVLFRHIISLNRTREDKDQIRTIVCAAKKPEDDPVLQKMNILGFASTAKLIDSTLNLLFPHFTDVNSRTTPDSDKQLTDDDTCRIKTTLLIRVGLLQAGVYIRLSPTKYVKMFREGDQFESNDYQRILNEKSLEHLFLRKDECSEFLNKFKNDLLVLVQAETLPENVYPELLEAIHETTSELLNKLGMTAEIQEVIKANVSLTIKAMGKSPKLSDILGKLEIDRDKYISSHSVLLPQIACTLAIAMDWKSEPTLQKLTLAAFMHDTVFTNQALAKVDNLTELANRKAEFTEEELKQYKTHPVKTSELAKQLQEVPPDIDTIILQHHERPNGSGFPRGLAYQHISPLGVVFIVAHDLVSALFDQTRPFVLERFIEEKKSEYVSGNFKKLLGHLVALKL
ncbi:MAG: HD domain-containing protein [Cryobacterium sp.]|nr:HD domain-containing protein [Oligoflexia bacterium]